MGNGLRGPIDPATWVINAYNIKETEKCVKALLERVNKESITTPTPRSSYPLSNIPMSYNWTKGDIIAAQVYLQPNLHDLPESSRSLIKKSPVVRSCLSLSLSVMRRTLVQDFCKQVMQDQLASFFAENPCVLSVGHIIQAKSKFKVVGITPPVSIVMKGTCIVVLPEYFDAAKQVNRIEILPVSPADPQESIEPDGRQTIRRASFSTTPLPLHSSSQSPSLQPHPVSSPSQDPSFPTPSSISPTHTDRPPVSLVAASSRENNSLEDSLLIHSGVHSIFNTFIQERQEDSLASFNKYLRTLLLPVNNGIHLSRQDIIFSPYGLRFIVTAVSPPEGGILSTNSIIYINGEPIVDADNVTLLLSNQNRERMERGERGEILRTEREAKEYIKALRYRIAIRPMLLCVNTLMPHYSNVMIHKILSGNSSLNRAVATGRSVIRLIDSAAASSLLLLDSTSPLHTQNMAHELYRALQIASVQGDVARQREILDILLRNQIISTYAAMMREREEATNNLRNERAQRLLSNIDNFTTAWKFSTPKNSTENEDDYRSHCLICLENYQPGELIRCLRCLHQFHDSCIRNWFTTAVTCPLCHLTIDDSFSEEVHPESSDGGGIQVNVFPQGVFRILTRRSQNNG